MAYADVLNITLVSKVRVNDVLFDKILLIQTNNLEILRNKMENSTAKWWTFKFLL